MKVYNGFPDKKTREKYVCKSEINRKLLRKMGIPDFVKVSYVIDEFNKIDDDKFAIVVLTGNLNFKNKTRHTKFVLKYVLYKELIKGIKRH